MLRTDGVLLGKYDIINKINTSRLVVGMNLAFYEYLQGYNFMVHIGVLHTNLGYRCCHTKYQRLCWCVTRNQIAYVGVSMPINSFLLVYYIQCKKVKVNV